MDLGPVSRIPAEMLRSDVLVCFGEDRDDWAAALTAAGAEPRQRHRYRGFEAWCNDDGLTVLAPFGSAAVEALLNELFSRPGIERIVAWGTAGALPKYSGPTDRGVAISKAVAGSVSGMKDGQGAGPTLTHDLPEARAISTDRFYGASPGGDHWDDVRHFDAVIDMESAPFYKMMADHDARCLVVRAVANPVDELAALPTGAPGALRLALDGAMSCF